MHLVLFLAAGAAVALLGECRSANVNALPRVAPKGLSTKKKHALKFLIIKQRPKDSYTLAPGTTLALTCVAIGAPAPSVHWYKNDALVHEYDMEFNGLKDGNLAHVSSTLLVNASSAKDMYTCLMRGGVKTARASTVVYTNYSSGGGTELSKRSEVFPLAPLIVLSYIGYIDTIGSNVVLLCRVKGHPSPRVTWKNNKGIMVNNDPRMKVLQSGALMISALQWSDLGVFICHAENSFGSKTAETFVYPAKVPT